MADLVGNIGGPKGDKGDRGDPTTINQGDGISVTGPAASRTVAARPSADDGNAFGFGSDGGGFVQDVSGDVQDLKQFTTIHTQRSVSSSDGLDFLQSDWGSILRIVSGGTLHIGDGIVDPAPAGATFIAANRTTGTGTADVSRDDGGNLTVIAENGNTFTSTAVRLGAGSSVIFHKVDNSPNLYGIGTGGVTATPGTIVESGPEIDT